MAAPRSPKPRLSREEIDTRNFRIFTLFVAGNSEREIGRAVGLSGGRVNTIIREELKKAGRHRRLLTDEALAVYQSRLETLIRMVWPKVAAQDLKAIEVARRVLEQQARLYDLEEERIGAIAPLAEQELADDDRANPVETDELARYRARHSPEASGQ